MRRDLPRSQPARPEGHCGHAIAATGSSQPGHGRVRRGRGRRGRAPGRIEGESTRTDNRRKAACREGASLFNALRLAEWERAIMILLSLFDEEHTGRTCVTSSATNETWAFVTRLEAEVHRAELARALLSSGCSVAFVQDRAVPARHLIRGEAWPAVAPHVRVLRPSDDGAAR